MRKKDISSNNYWKNTNKFLLVMKLTTLLIFVTTLQMSANLYSQETKIDLNVYNGTIADVFNEIEKQSDFRIFYNVQQIDLTKRIDYSAQSKSINRVLDDVLGNFEVSFELYDKVIVIVPSDFSQSQKVTGVVTDATTGEKLPGVNILIEGTNTGVITDVNGRYSIELPSPNMVLLFSYVGYNTERIEVTGKSTIDISLVPDIKSLEEVVVVGYGTQRKVTATGSVVSARGDDLKKSPSINLTNNLVGRMPGLTAVTRSGEPGYDCATLRIRGSNTLGNNSPLIV